MADTLTRVQPVSMGISAQLWNVLMRKACERWGHSWRLYGREMADGWNLPHGKREYCTRCEGHRVTFKADGKTEECSKAELLAAEPTFAEAVYEARWGERPKAKLYRGQWPAI